MGFITNVAGALGFKHRARNPADTANNYLQRIPQEGVNQLNPYIQRGYGAENNANAAYDKMYSNYENLPDLYENPGMDFNESPKEYENMARDPNTFFDNIMKNYNPSEGYKFKENRMLRAAGNSAASGGYAGTAYDKENSAGIVKDLLSEDMQQFISNILGIQGKGLAGEERRIGRHQDAYERMLGGRERTQERRLLGKDRALQSRALSEEAKADRGFDASKMLSDLFTNNLSQQGTLGYMGQLNQNEGKAAAKKRFFDFLSKATGSYDAST